MIVERQYVNPMEMTFIGKDGSMGLRHGKTYRVLMFCAEGHIWVSWNDSDDRMKVCPYTSLNTMYANWKTPAPKLSNEGAYKIIAKHLYRAHRMYTGGKTLVILADSIEEATEVEYRRHTCPHCQHEWLEDRDASDYPNYCPACGEPLGKED